MRKRWKSVLLYASFLVLVLLVAGELTVRIMGYTAWSKTELRIEIEPGGSFFKPDTLLGYSGRPGTFKVLLQDTLAFHLSHNAQGYRITGHQGLDTQALRSQIWLFGCSFTHGYGVDDEAAFPWRLQAAFPACEIRNFAMSGFGTYQSLLQIESLLKKNSPPKAIVLAYGAFHEQRNTSNRFWRKALAGTDIVAHLSYPYVRLDENGNLRRMVAPLAYKEFPGMRFSALVHYLEMAYNRNEDNGLQSKTVSRMLIRNIETICEENHIQFLLTGIYRHPGTTAMLAEFGAEGIPVADISVDTDDPRLRILPEDGHPNERAHRQIADSLIAFFREQGICAAPN